MQRPPRLSRRLLKLLISEELYDDIDGDLNEVFMDRIDEHGIGYAKAHHFKDVLFSIRNIGLRRKLKYFNPLVMYKNYLKISFRNLLNHKGYSLINITGLALGMAACLLILLFVENEKNFDGFHTKKNDIYRLDEVQTFGDVSQKVALSMFPMGPTMLNDYPEVVNFTRFWSLNKLLLERNDQRYYLDQTVRVDTSFFDIFDFNIIRGNPEDFFSDGYNLVLTESVANRIFGDENPIGEILNFSEEERFIVAAVIEDIPDESHLQFEALIPMTLWDSDGRRNNWGSNFVNTYLQLVPNADIQALEAKFDDFLIKYTGDEDILDAYELFLQPLNDVHLGSMDITHDYQNHKKFSQASVNIFLILAFFVLLIASVNFMNLSTAAVANRSKEVGVRKSIGAHRSQISTQFLVQSILLSFISLVIALLICFASVDVLNQTIDRALSLKAFFTFEKVIITLVLTLFIGMLSGLYPATVMSQFNVITALKGASLKSGKSIFRNALVVLQYAIAIAVIIGTTVVVKQLNFMQSMDLGFDRDRVITLPMYYDTNENYDLLKDELESQVDVISVTATSQRLGNNLHQAGMKYRNDTALVESVSSFVQVDLNFVDVYDIEIIAGRSLSEDYETDKQGNSFLVNRALAKVINQDIEKVIGTGFHFGGADTLGTIVGVVEDFKYNKLTNVVEPLFLNTSANNNWSEANVKLRGGNLNEALSQVEATWQNLYPTRPFEYKFLDEHFDELYRSEQQLVKVISVLSVLAIIIASLGLFGLSSFIVRQRMKEMGIRKVLGASVPQILAILSKQFSVLILIAFVVATPITYYLLGTWLEDYAFSITLGIGIFLVVGIASWLLALITVSIQSLQVARLNPVKTLRIE